MSCPSKCGSYVTMISNFFIFIINECFTNLGSVTTLELFFFFFTHDQISVKVFFRYFFTVFKLFNNCFNKFISSIVTSKNSYSASTRSPRHVPWGLPKGTNVRDLQWNFRRLLEDQNKNWWVNDKCFWDSIVLPLHIYYCFSLENKYSKVLNGDVHGTPTGPICGSVLGTFLGRGSYRFFKFNSETYETYFDRLLKTLKLILVARNLVNSIVIKKII